MENGQPIADDLAPELYRKHRPRMFKDIVGQGSAVSTLTAALKSNALKHAILFSGPSGVGKTTIARILAQKLKCEKNDLQEINCALVDGAIETVRSIGQMMRLAPMHGTCRVYVLDEVQSLSRAGFAQQSLLKLLEDTPSHVYFFLCTTDPSKLIKAILTRCEQIVLKAVGDGSMMDLLTSVCQKEKVTITATVLQRIIEVSEGSPRQALVLLGQIVGLPEQDQLKCILSNDSKRQAFDIVKALLWEKTSWPDMAKLLRETEIDDAERFRHLVLANARNELLKGNRNSSWAGLILTVFRDPWHYEEKTGLARCCFDVLSERK